MIRCETYRDNELQIPHGRFAWYNNSGHIDSTGLVSFGKKTVIGNTKDRMEPQLA